MGRVDGSGSTWTTVDPATAVAAEPQQLAVPAVKVEVNEPKAAPFNEEESLAALKGYRSIAEQRLKELDEKLKEIQD
jgi:hypothetical protein